MNLLLSKKLKYFIAVMEARNINLAADQLYITRSPLGRVLNELEEHVDGKLFVRKYNHLEPTELACNLYERLKPLYDILCVIECEFGQRKLPPYLELLFDISIPDTVYQYFVNKIRIDELPIICRQISVTSCDIAAQLAKPWTALCSYRIISHDDNIRHDVIGSDSLVVFTPECIDARQQNLTLFIKKSEYFMEIKGLIYHHLKNLFHNIVINETDNDLSSLLFFVSSGAGALVMPEHLSSYFSPPRTKKMAIPGITLELILYSNNNYEHRDQIEDVVNTLRSYR